MNLAARFLSPKEATGRALARVLAGSWRRSPPTDPFISDAILKELTTPIRNGGGAGLAWFRISRSGTETSASVARHYREAWISSLALEAAHERDLERVSRALWGVGIRFIVLKGWSVARSYPERGLRPLGDTDIWIDPDQRLTAESVVANLPISRALDLDHDQFHRFEDREFRDFYGPCETAYLGSSPIRVLRLEDQIRMLCLHFLKHGGWRPIWLCDIAVLLESQNGIFDWELCLGSNPRQSRWVGSTIALARELLGARIPGGAPPHFVSSSPNWLTRTVLQEWRNPRPPSAGRLRFVLPSLWRKPWEVKAVMGGRWRNAIQATVDCRGPFDGLPRWPFQLTDAALRATRFGTLAAGCRPPSFFRAAEGRSSPERTSADSTV